MAKKKRKPKGIVREDGGPSPEEGGPQEVLASERASATPLSSRAVSEPIADQTVTAAFAQEGGVEGPLDRLQAWFNAVITHPRSAADGVQAAKKLQEELGAEEIEELVTPSPRLPAIDRLAVYQFAYHARLVECLADDYPAVQFAIGHNTFDTLARKYVEAHPSQNANLNYFGKKFASFVREQSWLDNYVFLSELARLEWAMVEVLHAPAAPAISLLGLSQLQPEQWAGIRLSPAPTLRFLELEFPANAFLQAMREGKKPPIPARAWSATAVYRQGYTVWRMTFTPPMARVLTSLLNGATLGEALDGLEVEPSEGSVMVWFREWIEGGFFASIDLGATSS